MIDTNSVKIEFLYNENKRELRNILKCLKTLYTTVEGTQPLDREFGLKRDFLGQPIPIAQNLYMIEVIEKTEKYEQRVQVSEVEFEIDAEDGKMIPIIRLEQREEEDDE